MDGEVPLTPVSGTFWLTRDCVFGELSDQVEIWVDKPYAVTCDDGDVVWVANLHSVDRKTTFYGEASYADLKSEFGPSRPETKYECVRVDRGGVTVKGQGVSNG